MNYQDFVCKQCGQPIYRAGTFAHEIASLEIRVIDGDPDPGTPTMIHLTDAGVFCSRKCLAEYLQKDEAKA